MYERPQLATLKTRMDEPRRRIQVLVGPRQVGKSTIIKQFIKGTTKPCYFVTADLVDEDNNKWISEQWAIVRSLMKVDNISEYILIIDEVQNINNWSKAVKKEWDADSFNDVNIKVILLGSSRLLIQDGLTESLAGRFELIRMTHWTFDEMQQAFDINLEQFIYFGGFPGSAEFISDEKRWNSYINDSIVEPAVQRDVLSTKRVFKPALMRQLFELGCAYSSQELSLNKVMGQLGEAGNVSTLASYLQTLGEAELLCGLRKYASEQARRYNSVPKFMVYNSALFTAMRRTTFRQAYTTPKEWGRWVETAVGVYLLTIADLNNLKLYYWRERNDEVDFILDRQDKCIAIEVKSGRRATNKGLQIFKDKFKPVCSLVVGQDAMPLEKFLKADINTLFT